MGIQNGLNFGGIDVEAKSDDEIFGAPHDEKMLLLEASEISRVEPAFGVDGSGGFAGRAIVAFHDVWSTHMQLAHFPGRDWLTILPNQSGFYSREHGADGIILARGHVDSYLGDVRGTFRDAVTVMERQAEQSLHRGFDRRGEWRPGTRNNTKAGKFERLQLSHLRVLQELRKHRRHT